MYFSSLIAVWDFSYLDFKSFLFSFFFLNFVIFGLSDTAVSFTSCLCFSSFADSLSSSHRFQPCSLKDSWALHNEASSATQSIFLLLDSLTLTSQIMISGHTKLVINSLMFLLTSSNLTQLYSVLVILPYNWVPPNMCGVIIATSKVLWRHLYDVKHNTTIDDFEARPSRY